MNEINELLKIFNKRYDRIPYLDNKTNKLIRYRYLATLEKDIYKIIKLNMLIDIELSKMKVTLYSDELRKARINYNNFCYKHRYLVKKKVLAIYFKT